VASPEPCHEWAAESAGEGSATKSGPVNSRFTPGTVTQLPLDHPRPPRHAFVGGTVPLTTERGTVEGLRRAARTAGGDLSHALAAAYAWWLHRYADSAEVTFGSLHDLRHRTDLSAVAGCCITPVVLRCDVSGEKPFTALIGEIRRVVTEALSDPVSFDSRLFPTALLFQPPLTSPADDWSLHVMESDVRDAARAATFDIRIDVDERPEGHLTGGLVFNTELFDHETAREMASHWRRLLNAVVAAPGLPMAEHDLVTPDARRRQLRWNSVDTQTIASQPVHEVISSQVERTPDAPAVQVGDTTLTYRQLDDRAAAIASRLVQMGAGPGTVVAVHVDRTTDLPAAILAVLKSGAAFMPLDPRQPPARNTFCINDTRASIVLADRQLPTGGDPVTATFIKLDELSSDGPRQDVRSSTVSADDLAYVICTSGSTGRPKPVLIEHRSVTNLMRTWSREVGVGASDTVLSVAAISFDLALGDVFCALACGAHLVLATTEQATAPAALSRLIADSGATYMCATPTTWGALVAAGWRGDRRLTAVTGGEALNVGLARALLQRCGSVWNAYGPTEATVWTNVARLAEGDTVNVGRSLPNVRVYITDACGRLQPVGVPGEIVIGGVAVGRGYLNRPDEHARRFCDDPFLAGGRIYRTGDRGRFLPDGRLQHLGRDDDQVKIRGFRIEPGEIESTLCLHPNVGCCAVVAREAPNGEQQLVAYLVGEPGCPTDFEARDWLRRRVPEYMVPGRFVRLNALPMTASGKLDKAALPAPSPLGTVGIGAQPPRNDKEKSVAALWADLLAVPVSDVNTDFFDMGGHSLMAARLISEIQRIFGVALAPAAFLDNGRTVAGLAGLLDSEIPATTGRVTSDPPLHFISADVASAMSVRHFMAQWGAAQSVHTLMPEQPGGRFDRSVTLEQHARQAISAICNRQPDGPIALAGYSIGGLLAYEVARQLVDTDRQVHWLGILDAQSPSLEPLLRAQLKLRWQLGRIRRMPAGERWDKYTEVARRVLRGGPGALWPQIEFDYRGATEILCRYRQPGHEVPVHLFVSEGYAAENEAHLLGWDEFHKGTLTVDRLAGDHFTMLRTPEVKQLAGTMLESLLAARASTRLDRPMATSR
jgi:amino acid adenylation domain-containing protein